MTSRRPSGVSGAVGSGGKRGDRARAATAVVLAAILLVTAGGFAEAGADDPTEPATPTSITPSSTPGSTSSTLEGAVDPSSTVPGGSTTSTTDPDAPPVTSGPGGFGPPKVDPDAPPEPPMPDPSPQVRVLLEQLLSQNHARLIVYQAKVTKQTRVDVSRFVTRETNAREALKSSQAALATTNKQIRGIEGDLRADALARYMNPGTTGIERMVDTKDTSGRTRAVLAEVTTGLHLEERSDALARRATLNRRIEANKKALSRAKAATARARTRANEARERAEKAAAKAAGEQQLIRIANQRAITEQAEARAAVIGPSTANWSLPIAGKSVFTGPELAAWFIQRGFPSRARAPITKLAQYYIDEGDDQDIRGDMAFAQSVLETGSFTNPDTIQLNNFAGIGHCDTCASGFAFATPQLGVRAQIQLLADYTQRGVVLAHPLVDRRLHGPSGCCQTWWQLTHTWATAGNYGPKIMGIYRQMLYWLVLRRGMTPLVGPG